MLRPLLLAAVTSLCACSTNVNLWPVSAPADALRPQRADLVEVYDASAPPERPFSRHVLLETKTSGVPSQDAAALRDQGGATGCDAILLREAPGQADCVLYNGKSAMP